MNDIANEVETRARGTRAKGDSSESDLAGRLTNGLSSLLLKCTLPVPRDPLGLRHSRPTGFDCADGDVNLKTLFNLIFINYPTTSSASHVRSAQDDSAGSEVRPRRSIAGDTSSTSLDEQYTQTIIFSGERTCNRRDRRPRLSITNTTR